MYLKIADSIETSKLSPDGLFYHTTQQKLGPNAYLQILRSNQKCNYILTLGKLVQVEKFGETLGVKK